MTDAGLLLNSDISWLVELCVLCCCTSLMFCFISHIVNFLVLIMSLFSSFQQRFCQQQASHYSPWSPCNLVIFFCSLSLVFLCSIPHRSFISLISPALSPSPARLFPPLIILTCVSPPRSTCTSFPRQLAVRSVFVELYVAFCSFAWCHCSEWCEALVQTLTATWQKKGLSVHVCRNTYF